jgi:hypothetical protein
VGASGPLGVIRLAGRWSVPLVAPSPAANESPFSPPDACQFEYLAWHASSCVTSVPAAARQVVSFWALFSAC